jgi:hypothetical protein
MTFFITGTRRGLGEALDTLYDTVNTLEECDVFINCKHDSFKQVQMLFQAAELNKRIINIGSNSPDQDKKKPHIYQIEKFALDKANDQLFYQGVNTTIIRFGYSIPYCVSVIDWVLNQPHRIKDITVCT